MRSAISIAVLLGGLAGIGHGKAGELLSRLEDLGRGNLDTHAIFDARDPSVKMLPEAETVVGELEKDGFLLLALPTDHDVTCGRYVLPTGLDAIRFRHDGRFPSWDTYYIKLTVSKECELLRATGYRRPPIGL